MTKLVINKTAVIKKISCGIIWVIKAHDQHSSSKELGSRELLGATHYVWFNFTKVEIVLLCGGFSHNI